MDAMGWMDGGTDVQRDALIDGWREGRIDRYMGGLWAHFQAMVMWMDGMLWSLWDGI